MSVTLKRQRDGQTWRPCWHGEYTDSKGKRKLVTLESVWKGTPPSSGSLRNEGDADFEQSRRDAEKELATHIAEERRKGRAEHLTERLIESKTGRAVEYARLADLPTLWRTVGRDEPCEDRHFKTCDARLKRFVTFMQERRPEAVCLYEVTQEDAAAFIAKTQAKLSRGTARQIIRLINSTFNRFLPVGASNPFKAFIGRRGKKGVEVIHRRPLTAEEIQTLFAAREDKFMHPLVVTAACSGMRRGDVCSLRWRDVDLSEGMVTVKTSKTGETVEIPIFPPLRAILESRRSNDKTFVFPEAATMLRKNPQGLSYRFKCFLTRALNQKVHEELPSITPAAEVKAECIDAIMGALSEGDRRTRTLDTLRRYCAGESVRAIHNATGRTKATISFDLNFVENLIGKSFIRSGQAPGIKADIARITRITRQQGERAASVLDWHSMRTTWVTLALSAGVPLEIVRRVTGHATVEVVMKHYFKPGREQFRAALAGALPAVLTGGKTKISATEELTALVGKLGSGTATDEDKKRLRLLAAKV